MNNKLAKLDMNTAQHEMLMNIFHKPGSSQQQLSDRLLVVKSNTSALLKKLTERGLIERRKHPDDARAHQLFLTSQGLDKLQQTMAVQIEMIQAMTGVLSDDEIKTNQKIMNRVHDALDLL